MRLHNIGHSSTYKVNQNFSNAQRNSNKQHRNSAPSYSLVHSIIISLPLIERYKIGHARSTCLCFTLCTQIFCFRLLRLSFTTVRISLNPILLFTLRRSFSVATRGRRLREKLYFLKPSPRQDYIFKARVTEKLNCNS